MKVNIKVTNMQLTPQITDYAEKKVGGLDKFISRMDESVQAWVEIGRTTAHHLKGDVYRAEIQIRVPHNPKGARVEATHEDLYAAIDEAYGLMKLELEKIKDKKISVVRRSARIFKKFIPFLGE
ncbi:MAG: ribosome-associated translation inhibitor RaiA [Candidatus Paceibacter sp.]|nr:ribosome-associated translation inhibitor RaiA [Candidatus Paceibacter sp.]